MAETAAKLNLSEVVIKAHPHLGFKELVAELESVLNLIGCGGCLSGLDRFVFQNPEVVEGIR